MPSYFYRARDINGQSHEGVEVAGSEEEVLRMLENARLTPVFIENREPGAVASLQGQIQTEWKQAVQHWRTSVKPVSVVRRVPSLVTTKLVGRLPKCLKP